MKNIGEFLKKHLVLVICIAVAVAALGAGIWFLVNPEQPEVQNPNSQTESTGDLGVDLDTDMGFGDLDMGSGVVNIPSGDKPSGEVNPITPDNKNENASGEEVQTPPDSENSQPDSGNGNQGSQQTPSGNGNQGSQQTPSGNGNQGSQQTPSGNGNQSGPQTDTVEMSGGVVANPFK